MKALEMSSLNLVGDETDPPAPLPSSNRIQEVIKLIWPIEIFGGG